MSNWQLLKKNRNFNEIAFLRTMPFTCEMNIDMSAGKVVSFLRLEVLGFPCFCFLCLFLKMGDQHAVPSCLTRVCHCFLQSSDDLIVGISCTLCAVRIKENLDFMKASGNHPLAPQQPGRSQLQRMGTQCSSGFSYFPSIEVKVFCNFLIMIVLSLCVEQHCIAERLPVARVYRRSSF